MTYWKSRQRLHLIRLSVSSLVWGLTVSPYYRRGNFGITWTNTPSNEISRTHVAIVAAYPESAPSYVKSLERLLRGFANQQVQPCVVMNRPPSAEIERVLSNFSCITLTRSNQGRDIGAYQAGIGWLLKTGRFDFVERLFLVNDTLHWTSEPDDVISSSLTGDWCAMFMSLNVKAHAQSFFLSFSKDILNNQNFLKFWKRYVPLNSRPWAINQGEIRLSTLLIKEGYSCQPYVTAGRVRSAASRLVKDRELAELFEDLEVGNDGGIEPPSVFVGRFTLGSTLSERRAAIAKKSEYVENPWQVDAGNHANTVANFVNAQGPHRIGLHLTLLLGLPLKTDIYKIYPLGTIERVTRLCDPECSDDLYLRLTSKAMRFMIGTYQSHRDRMLMEK